MRRWRSSKSLASSLESLVGRSPRPPPPSHYVAPRCSSTAGGSSQTLNRRQAIPCGSFRWGSTGPCRGYSNFATGFAPLQLKPLDSIVDVERLRDRPAEEIASAWDDYHLGRGHIGASMKAKLFRLLEHRAADCRYFVIPLWRGSGYTTMFVQVQMPHILFTGLEDYKARGTQAAPYLTVTCYPEFAESKDLVLIRGDIVFTSKLTDEEAKWLMEAAQPPLPLPPCDKPSKALLTS